MDESKKTKKNVLKRALTGLLAFALVFTGLPVDGFRNEVSKAALVEGDTVDLATYVNGALYCFNDSATAPTGSAIEAEMNDFAEPATCTTGGYLHIALPYKNDIYKVNDSAGTDASFENEEGDTEDWSTWSIGTDTLNSEDEINVSLEKAIIVNEFDGNKVNFTGAETAATNADYNFTLEANDGYEIVGKPWAAEYNNKDVEITETEDGYSVSAEELGALSGVSPYVYINARVRSASEEAIKIYPNDGNDGEYYTFVDDPEDGIPSIEELGYYGRVGYTFLGYDADATATSPTYALKNGVVKVTGGETTLYSIWKAKTMNVEFYSNDGKTKAADTVTWTMADSSVTLPTANSSVIKDYYEFTGWTYEKGGDTETFDTESLTVTGKNFAVDGKSLWDLAANAVGSTTKLYAVQSEISYAVQFRLAGVDTSAAKFKVNNVDKTAGVKYSELKAAFAASQNVVFDASGVDFGNYVLVSWSDGNNNWVSSNVAAEDVPDEAQRITKSNYADFFATADEDHVITLTANTTLDENYKVVTAILDAVDSDATFVGEAVEKGVVTVNGNKATYTEVVDKESADPVDFSGLDIKPQVKGQRFNNWYASSSAEPSADVATTVTAGGSVYAKYGENQYTLTYTATDVMNEEGETAELDAGDPVKYTEGGSVVTVPSGYGKTGYRLIGWTNMPTTGASFTYDDEDAFDKALKAANAEINGEYNAAYVESSNYVEGTDWIDDPYVLLTGSITSDELDKLGEIVNKTDNAKTETAWAYYGSAITLKPVYVKEVYTATFVVNGATSVTNGNIEVDHKTVFTNTFSVSNDRYAASYEFNDGFDLDAVVPNLASETAGGFVFDGWYADAALKTPVSGEVLADLGTGASEEGRMYTGNFTVYAGWRTVHFFVKYQAEKNKLVNNSWATTSDWGEENFNTDEWSTEYRELGTTDSFTYNSRTSAGTFTLKKGTVFSWNGYTFDHWTLDGSTDELLSQSYNKKDYFTKDDADATKVLVDENGTFVEYYENATTYQKENFDIGYLYYATAGAEGDAYTIKYVDVPNTTVLKALPKTYEVGDPILLPLADAGATVEKNGYSAAVQKAMAVENKTFLGWYTSSSYEADEDVTSNANGWTVANKVGNLTLYARYADDAYWFKQSVGSNASYLDGEAPDATKIAVTGTLPSVSFSMKSAKAEEGYKILGWTVNNGRTVYPAGTAIADIVEDEDAALTKANDPSSDDESNTNTLKAVVDMTYMATYVTRGTDGTLTTVATEELAVTKALPDDTDNRFVSTGQKLTGWKSGSKTFVTGAVYDSSEAKNGWKNATWTIDSTNKVKTATFEAVFSDAYTITFAGADTGDFTYIFAGDEYSKATIEATLNAYTAKATDGEEETWAPTKAGYTFKDANDYAFTYGTNKTKQKLSVKPSVLFAGAESKSLTVDLIFTPNKYSIWYVATPAVNVDRINIAPETGIASQAALNDVAYKVDNLQAEYDKDYTLTAKSTDAVITAMKFGTFKNWKAMEVVVAKNDAGVYELKDLVALSPSNYSDGATVKNLTATASGTILMVAQYDYTTTTISFTGGTASGSTVKGSKASVKTKFGDDNWLKSLTLTGFTAEGYELTGFKGAKGVYTNEHTYGDIVAAEGYPKTLSLEGQWNEVGFGITYHAEGGSTEAFVPADYIYKSSEGKSLKYPANANGNYTFAGWFYDSAKKKAVENNMIPVGTKGELDLYAGWVPKTVTVTLYPNTGVSGDTQSATSLTCNYNADVKIPKNTFKKDGYVFGGWAVGSATGNATIADAATTSFTANTELYATWAKKGETKFNVTLSLANATLTDATGWTTTSGGYTATYTYGTALSLPKVTANDYYSFDGWYLDGKKITKISASQVGDLTITGKVTGKKFTVSYNANAPANSKASGKTASTTVYYGSEWAPAASGFTVKGFSFLGWATTADAKTPTYKMTGDGVADYNYSTWTATENLKLYAVWDPDDEFVRFISPVAMTVDATGFTADNDGTSDDGWTYTYKYTDISGKKITLPTAVTAADSTMTFAGWYKAKKDTLGEPTTAPTGKKLTTIAVGSDTVYVAKWTGNYTITYHNGVETATQTVKAGKTAKLKALKKISKEWAKTGYFIGWATADDTTHAVYKNKAKISSDDLIDLIAANDAGTGNGEIDLYAVFEDKDKTYPLTLRDTEGNVVIETTYTYKKGLSKKKLTKLGKQVAASTGETYSMFTTTLGSETSDIVKNYKSIKKKTAGALDLTMVAKGTVNKITFKFDANAPDGVKVTGKVKNAKVNSNTKYLKGKNKFKASGYTLLGYNDDAGNFYALSANGKLYYHDGIDDYIGEAVAQLTDTTITLHAMWQNNNEGTSYTYYYDTDADYDDNAFDGYGFDWYEEKGVWQQTFVGALDELPRPSRIGYTFAGWKEYNGKGAWVDTTKAMTGAYVRYLKATWTKIS